jgi:hypothetical protein
MKALQVQRAPLSKKYDYKTGKIYKQVDLDSKYFWRRHTTINDKMYQLRKKGLSMMQTH